MTYCAAKNWNVCTVSGSGIPAGMVRLEVFRDMGQGGKFRPLRGDKNGLTVSREEAERIKREHGYCTRFYRVDNAMLRAVYRGALAEIMEEARKAVMAAKDKAEICDIATSVTIRIRALPGDNVLSSLAWSNGVFTMARKFRADIWN